jgi:hypothetical protein
MWAVSKDWRPIQRGDLFNVSEVSPNRIVGHADFDLMQRARTDTCRLRTRQPRTNGLIRVLVGVLLTLAFFLTLGRQTVADETETYRQRFGHVWTKTDFAKHHVPPDEILSGGPPPDGIPSIDAPKFSLLRDGQPTGWVQKLDPLEPVISLSINGDARAYPLRILTWHEIVNDEVGGEAVVVTYCPLCNSSLVFKRELKGQLLEFGTTGLLRHSDLVMYDRQTKTWWQQFTGDAIVGSLAGAQLDFVPSRLESFVSFQTRHPNGRVLIPNNPEMRDYGMNPYVGYDSSTQPFLFRGNVDVAPHQPMDRFVAFILDGKAIAVPLSLLRQEKEVVTRGVRVRWSAGQNSALDTRAIESGRDVGNVVVTRAVGDERVDVPYHVTFAFAFRAFHPDGVIVAAAATSSSTQ